MNRSDLILAALFLVFGVHLVVSASYLPAGAGRVPGPGFFPQTVGMVVLLLAAVLLTQALRGRSTAEFIIENHIAIGGAIGLTALFLLLWGTGFFALRTLVFLTLFLRFLGEQWRQSLTVSAVLTVAVVGAFQYGLRVSLE